MGTNFVERMVRDTKESRYGSEDDRIMIRTLEIGTEILRESNLLRVPTVGSSMYPVSTSGDIITVRPTTASDVSAGDVVVYKAGRRIVAHRLISKQKKNNQILLICQGDAFAELDPPVRPEQVLGKVVAVSRNGRTIRLDTVKSQLIGLLLVKTSPLRPWLYPMLRKVGRIGKKIPHRVRP